MYPEAALTPQRGRAEQRVALAPARQQVETQGRGTLGPRSAGIVRRIVVGRGPRPVRVGLRQALKPGEQPVGRAGQRAAREHAFHLALRVRLRLAVGARGEVGQHAVPAVVGELTVDESRQALPEVVIGPAAALGTAHSAPPSSAHVPAGTAARTDSSRTARSERTRGERWRSALRRCERPRWIRLRTVPSFTPSVVAISS